jgi:uncharacterized membrane protein HdeD (DUF308 family)
MTWVTRFDQHRNRAWFVSLGLMLILAGLVALAVSVSMTLATTTAFGWLLLLAGISEIIGVSCNRREGGFFFHLLAAALSAAVGVLFVWEPFQDAWALSMLLAFLLMVGGIFKIDSSGAYQFNGWGWSLASGIIDLMLGIILWVEMPISALWVVGMFAGISLVFRGFNWIGSALTVRAAAAKSSDENRIIRPRTSRRPVRCGEDVVSTSGGKVPGS